jgi:hypothetical protein
MVTHSRFISSRAAVFCLLGSVIVAGHLTLHRYSGVDDGNTDTGNVCLARVCDPDTAGTGSNVDQDDDNDRVSDELAAFPGFSGTSSTQTTRAVVVTSNGGGGGGATDPLALLGLLALLLLARHEARRDRKARHALSRKNRSAQRKV